MSWSNFHEDSPLQRPTGSTRSSTVASICGLLAIHFALLAPLAYVFAHEQHSRRVELGQDQDRRATILLHSRCAMCYSVDLILQQRLDRRA
ncbi:MAG: hypothetical protein H0W13_09375 [Nitrospirales bacterium]|nr:hypothetical protein [Nitrospirales bacterium]